MPGPLNISDPNQVAMRYDYDASGNMIYMGRSNIKAQNSAAVWEIRKFTYSGSNLTSVTWADGNRRADNVWDDRASLSYS
ncbi:MAG: hypothetical protein AB7O68_16940 [Pirellulales bacterium]